MSMHRSVCVQGRKWCLLMWGILPFLKAQSDVSVSKQIFLNTLHHLSFFSAKTTCVKFNSGVNSVSKCFGNGPAEGLWRQSSPVQEECRKEEDCPPSLAVWCPTQWSLVCSSTELGIILFLTEDEGISTFSINCPSHALPLSHCSVSAGAATGISFFWGSTHNVLKQNPEVFLLHLSKHYHNTLNSHKDKNTRKRQATGHCVWGWGKRNTVAQKTHIGLQYKAW